MGVAWAFCDSKRTSLQYGIFLIVADRENPATPQPRRPQNHVLATNHRTKAQKNVNKSLPRTDPEHARVGDSLARATLKKDPRVLALCLLR